MDMVVGGVVLVVLFLVVIHLSKGETTEDKEKFNHREPIVGKRMMTANMVNLYEKLDKFLPNHTILSKVSFSAFLYSKDFTTRLTFNRKYADFVILDRNYEIVCIVELDNGTFKRKLTKVQQRIELCKQAGYQVVYFVEQPNMKQIEEKFGFLVQPVQQAANESESKQAV